MNCLMICVCDILGGSGKLLCGQEHLLLSMLCDLGVCDEGRR